jgi:hypothetical protein
MLRYSLRSDDCSQCLKVESPMECVKCHEHIPADTDDHYNSTHTHIKCPACHHWQIVPSTDPVADLIKERDDWT